MNKSLREIVKIAREEGIERARIEYGRSHDWLVGDINGKVFQMTVSRTEDWFKGVRGNIRRELRRMSTSARSAGEGVDTPSRQP